MVIVPEVSSTCAYATQYDTEKEVLSVTYPPTRSFPEGRTYDYLDVPKPVFDKMLKAESIGRFINFEIKPKYRYIG